MEGFTDIDYRKIEINIPATLVKTADFGIVGAPGLVPVIDSGMPVKRAMLSRLAPSAPSSFWTWNWMVELKVV